MNVVDPDGLTALHYAVNNAHMSAVEALIANGANVDCIAINGQTPLYIASFKVAVDAALTYLRVHLHLYLNLCLFRVRLRW